MIEIFKTNVRAQSHAEMLISQIHKVFNNYEVDFDLDDRNNILRIKSTAEAVQSSHLISLLRDFGFKAELLNDSCCTK